MPARRSPHPLAAALALTALVVSVPAPASASASARADADANAAAARPEVRTLCAERATLKSTPGNGIVIAHLRRPQRLVLEMRTPEGAWAYVRTRAGTRGWILAKALCRR